MGSFQIYMYIYMYMYIYICICIFMWERAPCCCTIFSADSSDAHRVCPQLRTPFSPSTRAYHRVAVWCSVLQCVAVHCRALLYAVRCSVQRAAVTRAYHLHYKSLRAPQRPATPCRRGDSPRVVSKAKAQSHLVL